MAKTIDINENAAAEAHAKKAHAEMLKTTKWDQHIDGYYDSIKDWAKVAPDRSAKLSALYADVKKAPDPRSADVKRLEVWKEITTIWIESADRDHAIYSEHEDTPENNLRRKEMIESLTLRASLTTTEEQANQLFMDLLKIHLSKNPKIETALPGAEHYVHFATKILKSRDLPDVENYELWFVYSILHNSWLKRKGLYEEDEIPPPPPPPFGTEMPKSEPPQPEPQKTQPSSKAIGPLINLPPEPTKSPKTNLPPAQAEDVMARRKREENVDQFLSGIDKHTFPNEPDMKPENEWKTYYGVDLTSARDKAKEAYEKDSGGVAANIEDRVTSAINMAADASDRRNELEKAYRSAINKVIELEDGGVLDIDGGAIRLMATLTVVRDLKFAGKQRCITYAEGRLAIRMKGYRGLGDIDGIFYVYAIGEPPEEATKEAAPT